MDKLFNYFLLLRVSHWSKAVFVMIGVIYSPVPGYLFPALVASFCFCLVASAVYIYNDIQDRSEDRLHPYKSNRPIASERVSIEDAIGIMFLLIIVGLGLSWLISKTLVLILTIYLLINLAYNHLFKLIPILDVLCIAMGFMLRVLAGTTGIGMPISVWLLIAATLLSLFIALNKRQLEIQLGLKNSTRKVLRQYHPLLLQRLISGTGVACLLTYILYIVYVREEAYYFVLTLPFAAIALWRFAWLSKREATNDDPLNVFLYDKLSSLNLLCFSVLTLMALL